MDLRAESTVVGADSGNLAADNADHGAKTTDL